MALDTGMVVTTIATSGSTIVVSWFAYLGHKTTKLAQEKADQLEREKLIGSTPAAVLAGYEAIVDQLREQNAQLLEQVSGALRRERTAVDEADACRRELRSAKSEIEDLTAELEGTLKDARGDDRG